MLSHDHDTGRLTGADQAMNGVSYTTALQYNVSAMTRTLTYPGQQTDVVETYDGRGRLNGITYGARDLIASSAYDLADRLTG